MSRTHLRRAAVAFAASLACSGIATEAASAGSTFWDFRPIGATNWGYSYARSTAGTACRIYYPTSGKKIGAGSPDVGYVSNWGFSSILWGGNYTLRPGCYNPHSVALTAVTGVFFSPGATASLADRAVGGPATAGVKEAIPAFTRPIADASKRKATELQRGFARLPTEAISAADWSAAKSAKVGDDRLAWLVPSGDQVCVVTPLATVANGASCHAPSELTGEATLSVAVGAGKYKSKTALAVVTVPAGSPAPVVVHADGSRDTLVVADNLATSTVVASDTVLTDGARVAISGYFPK